VGLFTKNSFRLEGDTLSKEELNKMDEILSHARSLDAQMTWVIRSNTNTEELKKLLVKFLLKRKRAAKVYLAVNGKRTSGQIAKYLDLHVQAVSNELTELENRGLIELKKWGIYKKSKINRILRLSVELRKDSDLENIK
jgi:DNA-binding transcriptional ArsR family regulator